MLSTIIVIIDSLIGFITGLIIIVNGYEEMIWRAIIHNDQNTIHTHRHIPQSKLLIMLLSTIFGVISPIFFIVAKKIYHK